MWGKQDEYFEVIAKNKPNIKEEYSKARLAQKKIQKQIKNGQIEINKKIIDQDAKTIKINQIQKQVTKKKNKIKKQMTELQRQILINKQMLRKAKEDISQMKYSSIEAQKLFQQRRKIEAIRHVSRWNQQRAQLQYKRQISLQKSQKKRKLQEEKQKKQEQQHNQFIKLEKRKIIQQRLKQMEHKKEERMKYQSIPNYSQVQSSIPKYLLAEKAFKQKQAEKQFQLQLLKKDRKMSMVLNAQALRAHQRAYIDRIKQRLNMKKSQKQQNNKDKRKVKSQFNLYLNRKQDKIKQQLQKMKRRQKFQQKINKIAISIDQNKKIERQISIDKVNHPLKYNYLSQKALSHQQIYKEFPNFQMNIDPKKLGKQYLQKLKQQPRLLKSSKSTLVQKIDTLQKPTYKNYIQQVKIKRQNLDQIEKTKRLYKNNKQLAKQALNKKSEDYQGNALNKIKELKNIGNYQQSVLKENQIDQMYMKSIKARIAYLELD